MELPLQLYYTGHEICEPKHGFGPAVRQQYLLHYIHRGRGWYRRADTVYPLEAGELFLIHPGELTYYEADDEAPWEYSWIGFHGRQARQLLEDCGLLKTPVLRVGLQHSGEIVSILEKIRENKKGNVILQTGLLYQFFSCLIDTAEQDRPTAARTYWKAAAQYIRNNYMYGITVAGVATFVGVDRSYLYRLFRQYQSISPQQYLIQCRVEEAKRMLRKTPYSVTEIAYSCGFADVATLDRAFRKLAGMSPSAFRGSRGERKTAAVAPHSPDAGGCQGNGADS